MELLRKIINIFIPARGNQLHIADISFDQKIRKISIQTKAPIEWEEIRTKAGWQRFQKKHSNKKANFGSENPDNSFLLLIPGAIDPHVHFDTPGFEFREDFEHASLAAAYGGTTTVIDMPCTSIPPVTTLENLQKKETALQERSWIDYLFWGGVAGNDLAAGKNVQQQIRGVAGAGVAGFKAYLISGMETFTALTLPQMEQVARWIKPTGLPLAVHAEDKKMVESRRTRMQKIGKNDWCGYYFARDERAEAMAVIQMINIARKTGCRIHIVHLSSEFGLELVRHAHQEGLPVTAETCPHYLYFTRDDFENPEIANYLKTAPPVKTEFDRGALWKGLANGTLSFVTTDHAGCNPEMEKVSDNFWEVYGGFPGVEHRVPFLFSEGFLKNRLTLQQTVDLLSTNAAKFFSLFPQKGSLEPGADADFTLVNLWEGMTVRAAEMHSKGKFTPFEGVRFGARVERTYLHGKVVTDREGKSEVKLGYGQFLIPPLKGD